MSLLNQSIIKHKMGLLNLAQELDNVSQACRLMGVSRDTFYRVKEAKEAGGLEALLHKDRRRPNLKNRVDDSIERAVLEFAVDNPAAGQFRVSNELRKRNVFISAGGVRSIWLRHGLQTFKLRLLALEKKVAELNKDWCSPKPSWRHWSVNAMMIRPAVKLTRRIQVIWAHKTPSTWAL